MFKNLVIYFARNKKKKGLALSPPAGGSKGFTLIEVVVATAIATVVATVVAFLFIQAISLNRELRIDGLAIKTGQNKIEELRRKPYSDILSLQNPADTDTDLPAETVTGLKDGELHTSIYNYDGNGDGSPDADIKKIKVEVKWTGNQEQNKSYLLYTLMSKRGLND